MFRKEKHINITIQVCHTVQWNKNNQPQTSEQYKKQLSA